MSDNIDIVIVIKKVDGSIDHTHMTNGSIEMFELAFDGKPFHGLSCPPNCPAPKHEEPIMIEAGDSFRLWVGQEREEPTFPRLAYSR